MRQGGVLSPALFAIFIDCVVDRIIKIEVGCYISSACVSIVIYADDILLLAPTVSALQILVTSCLDELEMVPMQVNMAKSKCMRFGGRFDCPCAGKSGTELNWSSSCKYLGVKIISGRQFRCCFDESKAKFFRAFNAVYGKIGNFASEVLITGLLKSKCLPILMYGLEACPLLSRDINSLQFVITRALMKVFRTGSAAVIKDCCAFFNILPLKQTVAIRTVKFLQDFIVSDNAVCTVFGHCAYDILDKANGTLLLYV